MLNIIVEQALGRLVYGINPVKYNWTA